GTACVSCKYDPESKSRREELLWRRFQRVETGQMPGRTAARLVEQSRGATMAVAWRPNRDTCRKASRTKGVAFMRLTAVVVIALGLAAVAGGSAVSQESRAASGMSGMSAERLQRGTAGVCEHSRRRRNTR